ncbi:MAG: hypothetical protein ACRDT9_01315 [Agromyces sp.]
MAGNTGSRWLEEPGERRTGTVVMTVPVGAEARVVLVRLLRRWSKCARASVEWMLHDWPIGFPCPDLSDRQGLRLEHEWRAGNFRRAIHAWCHAMFIDQMPMRTM